MKPESGYLPLQQPGAVYGVPGAASGAVAGASKGPATGNASVPPAVEFAFFALSTIAAARIPKLIANVMALVRAIWRPRADKDDYESTRRFEVKSTWNGSFTTVGNNKGEFSRIDFPRMGSATKALKLVQDNFANPEWRAVVPVFICDSAWDEVNEPGLPRDGLMKGFTLVRSLPWFTGERAILLFASQLGPRVLAHELSHWCGFTHKHFEGNRDNVGAIGGGGFDIGREQLRKYHRWATETGFRKTLAGQ